MITYFPTSSLPLRYSSSSGGSSFGDSQKTLAFHFFRNGLLFVLGLCIGWLLASNLAPNRLVLRLLAGSSRLDHFAGGLVWSRCAQEPRDPSSGDSGAVIFSFGTVGVVREGGRREEEKWGWL